MTGAFPGGKSGFLIRVTSLRVLKSTTANPLSSESWAKIHFVEPSGFVLNAIGRTLIVTSLSLRRVKRSFEARVSFPASVDHAPSSSVRYLTFSPRQKTCWPVECRMTLDERDGGLV